MIDMDSELDQALEEKAKEDVKNEVMGAICPWYPEGVFKSKKELEEHRKNYADGKRIYLNRLIFYPAEAYNKTMISLGQLFFKDIGIDDHAILSKATKWRKPEIKVAIFHTMVYEEALIAPLIACKIPITVFKDRDRNEKGPLVESNNASNINYVHQNKWGNNFFGVFHSKLMLLEFDDRLRVVISSSNLYRFDWELMSQVIWF